MAGTITGLAVLFLGSTVHAVEDDAAAMFQADAKSHLNSKPPSPTPAPVKGSLRACAVECINPEEEESGHSEYYVRMNAQVPYVDASYHCNTYVSEMKPKRAGNVNWDVEKAACCTFHDVDATTGVTLAVFEKDGSYELDANVRATYDEEKDDWAGSVTSYWVEGTPEHTYDLQGQTSYNSYIHEGKLTHTIEFTPDEQ